MTRFAPLSTSALQTAGQGSAHPRVRWPRAEWNATDRDVPGATVAQLFEEQVARTPDVVALRFEDRRRTYAELNAAANRLAQELVARGVGPEYPEDRIYFEGGKRLPPPNSGNILSAAFADGWFWYIPLTPELTSVGAVVHRDAATKVQGDPELALHHEFLVAFYGMHASEQSYFWEAKKITNCPLSELEAFVELDGRVGALHATGVVASAMRAGARVQTQVLLGADAGEETPLFADGLVSATDGVHWVHPST